MSPWGNDRFPKYAPKKPPPTRGIKVKNLGGTWWGQRWIEALERVLGADANRLARGRTYARAGRTHDFVVDSGKVAAQVTGSRAEPYQVSIALDQLPGAAWQVAIAFMAQKADFTAKLLNREMPQLIDEAFAAAQHSLFPVQRSDLRTSCNCPDWGDPCKHVAAVHYVLGEALDRDPFLLFELRGRNREQVLGALRSARGTSSPIAISGPPAVALRALTPEEYDAPREPVPTLSFSFDEPAADGAVLRQLGAPPGWTSSGSPVEDLAPVLRQAAEAARRLALADSEAPAKPLVSEPPPIVKKARRQRRP